MSRDRQFLWQTSAFRPSGLPIALQFVALYAKKLAEVIQANLQSKQVGAQIVTKLSEIAVHHNRLMRRHYFASYACSGTNSSKFFQKGQTVSERSDRSE